MTEETHQAPQPSTKEAARKPRAVNFRLQPGEEDRVRHAMDLLYETSLGAVARKALLQWTDDVITENAPKPSDGVASGA